MKKVYFPKFNIELIIPIIHLDCEKAIIVATETISPYIYILLCSVVNTLIFPNMRKELWTIIYIDVEQ